MTNRKVTLGNPMSNSDLHKKLFNGIYSNRIHFEKNNIVHLFILKKYETNRRIFFSDHKNWCQDEYVLLGTYKFHNFYVPDASALALSQVILNRINQVTEDLELSKEFF